MMTFLVIGVVLIIIEIITPGIFFFLAFGIGFILNSLVYKWTNSLNFSLISTAITSAIVFFILKKFFPIIDNKDFKSNMSRYEGRECTVIEVLENNKYKVKVYSEVWNGVSEKELSIGETAKVMGRKDNTLILEKLK